MTPKQIKALRRKMLRESVTHFGARFCRSPRTVEDWEQGRRTPDRLVKSMLQQLAKSLKKPTATP